MIVSETERLVLERLRPELENDGFTIIEQPDAAFLPVNVRGYVPDFVAMKGRDFVAYEIKAKRNSSIHKKLDEIKSQIEQSPNWKFRVIYAEELSKKIGVEKVSVESISNTLKDIKKMKMSGFNQAALLLGWATFEAVARHRHPQIFAASQTSGRVVTVLAERGLVSHGSASRLRNLATIRNSLSHGELSVSVSADDVEFLSSIIEALLCD